MHHIGYIVSDLDAAVKQFEKFMSFAAEGGPVHDPVQDAAIVFGTLTGGQQVELIKPASENSTVYQFLKKGGGLHHLCFEVDDIEKIAEACAETGAVMVMKPVEAAAMGKRRVCFVYSRETGLIEFVEKAAECI